RLALRILSSVCNTVNPLNSHSTMTHHVWAALGALCFSPAITNAQLSVPGQLDPSFAPPSKSEPNGPVLALVTQPDGKILIAGDFTQAGRVNYQNVARLNRDGSLDASFNPGAGA